MIQRTVDPVLAAGAVSSPWWLAYLNDVGNVIAVVLGVVLLLIRIAISIREWRSKPSSKD